MKQRYTLRVFKGSTVIGEYTFNATAAGLQELKDFIKPEFQYNIMDADGIIYTHQ